MRTRVLAVLLALSGLGIAACDARPAEQGGGGFEPTTGAHPAHLNGTPLAEPIGCAQCHDASFAVTLQGSVASANGATPTFNSSELTCSNVYCHSGGPQLPLGGGTVPTPKWNPPSVVGCGGCHSAPGDGTPASWHPAVATGVQCALCHPGYTNTTVNKPLHVNGVANVQPADLATNCAGCHGDPARVLPPGTPTLVKAAPPVDRNGSSSPAAVGVGAHQGHVLPGANALALPISCDQCHVVPTDLSHVGPLATTPATVIWGSLASANGATPAIAPAAPGSATVTCSNVYCHGGGPGLPLGGGTLTNPSWNPPSAVACGSCHALPGGAVDTSSWHPAVATGADCGLCHTGYTRAFVNLTAHVNGLVDVSSPTITTSCSACHGDSSRAVPAGEELLQAAPPVDRHGSSDTKQVGVGAHQAHLMPGASAIANPIACTECHVVPTDLLHVGPGPNTPATLNWGPLATTGGVDPTFDQVKATCTNYCHGALQTGGSNTSPIWNVVNGTQARCGTCHGNPPTSGVHVQHASPDFYGVSCGVCHPTGYAYGVVGPAAVDVHVNGSVNMNPAGFGNWSGTAAGPSGWKGTATGCHGGTRYWYPGSVPTCQ